MSVSRFWRAEFSFHIEYWLPTHPYLIKYFFTYSSITVDPLFVLVASDDGGPQHIGMLLMVCRLRELVGANVPHGLGEPPVLFLAYHGLFS